MRRCGPIASVWYPSAIDIAIGGRCISTQYLLKEELEANLPLRPRKRALSRRGSDGSDGPTCPRKRLCFGVEDVEVIELTKDDPMDY